MDSEYKLQVEAFVDGELSLEQQQRMRETFKEFPELLEYKFKIEKQRKMLGQWWEKNKNEHH